MKPSTVRRISWVLALFPFYFVEVPYSGVEYLIAAVILYGACVCGTVGVIAAADIFTQSIADRFAGKRPVGDQSNKSGS